MAITDRFGRTVLGQDEVAPSDPIEEIEGDVSPRVVVPVITGTGIVARLGPNSYEFRTIGKSGEGLSVTNGDGTGGDPTISLADDVQAIESLTGTGILRRTGTNAWSLGTTVSVSEGGTGITTYTLGDILYASAANTLGKLAGNTTTTRKYLSQTGDGTNSGAPAWSTPGNITGTNDTNVTLTLGGTPTGATFNSVSFTLGWSGTLAVARGGTGGGTASGTLLDNITGFSATGVLVRTGAGSYAFRTLTGPAAGITVTNGDGVGGNPTLALANDLAAVEGLSATGIVRRTAADTWSAGTTVAVSEGGTGATTASGARTNLGLAIGTDVQAFHARLADIAGIAYAQGDILYYNGTNLVKLAAGVSGQFLKTQGAGANPMWDTPTGAGDVTGPASSTNGNVAIFNGTTGKIIADGGKGLPSGAIVGTTDSQTLTNKTINGSSNTLTNINLASAVTGTLPVANGGTGVTSMPAFRVHRNGVDQTGLASGAFVLIQFTTKEFDTTNAFDNTTNYRFQPTVAGKYLLTFTVTFLAPDSTQRVGAFIYKNGSNYAGTIVPSNSNNSGICVSSIVALNGSTDYVDFRAQHTSSSSKDVIGSAIYTHATGCWIAP